MHVYASVNYLFAMQHIQPELSAIAVDQFIKSLPLPKSTFAKLVREGNGPRMFVLGRRRYLTSDDAQQWLERMRDKFAYVKRTNNTAARSAA